VPQDVEVVLDELGALLLTWMMRALRLASSLAWYIPMIL
jgi:hypothetical protein